MREDGDVAIAANGDSARAAARRDVAQTAAANGDSARVAPIRGGSSNRSRPLKFLAIPWQQAESLMREFYSRLSGNLLPVHVAEFAAHAKPNHRDHVWGSSTPTPKPPQSALFFAWPPAGNGRPVVSPKDRRRGCDRAVPLTTSLATTQASIVRAILEAHGDGLMTGPTAVERAKRVCESIMRTLEAVHASASDTERRALPELRDGPLGSQVDLNMAAGTAGSFLLSDIGVAIRAICPADELQRALDALNGRTYPTPEGAPDPPLAYNPDDAVDELRKALDALADAHSAIAYVELRLDNVVPKVVIQVGPAHDPETGAELKKEHLSYQTVPPWGEEAPPDEWQRVVAWWHHRYWFMELKGNVWHSPKGTAPGRLAIGGEKEHEFALNGTRLGGMAGALADAAYRKLDKEKPEEQSARKRASKTRVSARPAAPAADAAIAPAPPTLMKEALLLEHVTRGDPPRAPERKTKTMGAPGALIDAVSGALAFARAVEPPATAADGMAVDGEALALAALHEHLRLLEVQGVKVASFQHRDRLRDVPDHQPIVRVDPELLRYQTSVAIGRNPTDEATPPHSNTSDGLTPSAPSSTPAQEIEEHRRSLLGVNWWLKPTPRQRARDFYERCDNGWPEESPNWAPNWGVQQGPLVRKIRQAGRRQRLAAHRARRAVEVVAAARAAATADVVAAHDWLDLAIDAASGVVWGLARVNEAALAAARDEVAALVRTDAPYDEEDEENEEEASNRRCPFDESDSEQEYDVHEPEPCAAAEAADALLAAPLDAVFASDVPRWADVHVRARTKVALNKTLTFWEPRGTGRDGLQLCAPLRAHLHGRAVMAHTKQRLRAAGALPLADEE